MLHHGRELLEVRIHLECECSELCIWVIGTCLREVTLILPQALALIVIYVVSMLLLLPLIALHVLIIVLPILCPVPYTLFTFSPGRYISAVVLGYNFMASVGLSEETSSPDRRQS